MMSTGRAVVVQPGVRLAVALVEANELTKKPVVECRVRRVGLVASRNLDSGRDLVEVKLAERYRGEHRRAARVRVHRVGDLLDGPFKHVGEDLAPYVGPGSAAA